MKTLHGSSFLAGLDLNLLHLFHVVYRERSVSQAASILSVSQSAVSHAMGRLRQQLGVSLFEQQGRDLVPTSMAHRLAPEVASALSRLDVALTSRRDFRPRRDVARLTLAMPSQIEPMFLPGLFDRVSKVAPDVVIFSVQRDRRGTRRDLENGRIDAALDATAPVDPELSSECLLHDTLCVIAASERHDAVNRDAYLAARHVAVSSQRQGPSLVDILLLREGIRRNVRVRCQRHETACKIAASSDLLLTIGSRHAQALTRAIDVSVLMLDIPLPPYQVYLYWARQRDDDPALHWLRGVLRDISAAASAKGPASVSGPTEAVVKR